MEGAVHSNDAVYKSDDTIISAIEIARTSDNAHTIMFLGTDDGYMLKVWYIVFYYLIISNQCIFIVCLRCFQK